MDKSWQLGQSNEMILKHDRNNHRRCSVRNVFLKIPKISQKSFCTRVSFLIKFLPQPQLILKKGLWYRFFHVNFTKLLRTPFLQNISEQLLLKNETIHRKLYAKPQKQNRRKSVKYNNSFVPLMQYLHFWNHPFLNET